MAAIDHPVLRETPGIFGNSFIVCTIPLNNCPFSHPLGGGLMGGEIPT